MLGGHHLLPPAMVNSSMVSPPLRGVVGVSFSVAGARATASNAPDKVDHEVAKGFGRHRDERQSGPTLRRDIWYGAGAHAGVVGMSSSMRLAIVVWASLVRSLV
jgi:hypothetical protein